jgi:hypothetical protein
VFYRLVAAQLIPNSESAYKTLSRLSAEARRAGTFPRLTDGTRTVEQPSHWSSPAQLLDVAARQFHVDRTEGQPYNVILAVEKATLVELARQATARYRLPIVAVRGFGSQTIKDEVADLLDLDDRPARMIYLGDYDPSGLDIERDFVRRVGHVHVERVAVRREHIDEYSLVPAPAKDTDSRTARMLIDEGYAVQVEAEAIPPDELQRLMRDGISQWFDEDVLADVIDREASERERLIEFARRWDGED